MEGTNRSRGYADSYALPSFSFHIDSNNNNIILVVLVLQFLLLSIFFVRRLIYFFAILLRSIKTLFLLFKGEEDKIYILLTLPSLNSTYKITSNMLLFSRPFISYIEIKKKKTFYYC